MAKKAQSEDLAPEDVETQLEIPKSKFEELRAKKYLLKSGSILMPDLNTETMKVEWVTVPQSRFDQKMQDKLFDFWYQMKKDEPKFDIEAKVKKLLIEVQ